MENITDLPVLTRKATLETIISIVHLHSFCLLFHFLLFVIIFITFLILWILHGLVFVEMGKERWLHLDHYQTERHTENLKSQEQIFYRARIWFNIVHSSHSSKYAIYYSQSCEARRNITTNLSKDDYQANLLKISTLSTPTGKQFIIRIW